MQYQDHISIQTPEGIELRLTLAGLGSRFFAALIDGLIRLAALVAAIVAFGLAGGVVTAWGTRGSSIASQTTVALGALVVFLLLFGYDVLFETLASGRTPGKRAVGLRVMRAEGTAVGFVASAVRNLLRLVDWLPFGFAAGVASILLSARNQRLGDLAAGTIVVVERPHRASPPAPIQGTQAMDHWDVSGISPRDIATVQSFLDRRGVLTERARAERAWELNARLRPKVAGAPPNLDAERFLEMLVAAKAARS